jgi:hypothetical protein
MICSWTHREAHSNIEIRDALRWLALKRFMNYDDFELHAAKYIWEARALFNFAIQNLKQQGVPPIA